MAQDYYFDGVLKSVFERVNAQTRADSEAAGQLTLNALIARLQKLPQDALCPLRTPHSYRGYYEQLAFESDKTGTVADALVAAKGALGQMFVGYKGGDYWMTGNTMTWLASYGSCGERIVGLIEVDGRVDVVTLPDD